MAIQIACVEPTLDENRVVRAYHAIGCEIRALERDCRHGDLIVRLG